MAKYNRYLTELNESDLSLAGATILSSQHCEKDEAECESVLRHVDEANTGRFDETQFILARIKLSNS